MDLTIIRMIALEREMEIRRQVARKAKYTRDDFLTAKREAQAEPRKPFFARFSGPRRSPQPGCECSQAACR